MASAYTSLDERNQLGHIKPDFLTFFRKDFCFLLKLLSSSGSRQNKDLLCSQGQILQDLCNACSVMTGECHGSRILALF